MRVLWRNDKLQEARAKEAVQKASCPVALRRTRSLEMKLVKLLYKFIDEILNIYS